MRRNIIAVLVLAFLLPFNTRAQTSVGIIAGNILDNHSKAVAGGTVQIISLTDSTFFQTTMTDRNGEFNFHGLPFGWFRLTISFIGLRKMVVDSIHVREERFDFNLPDLVMKEAQADVMNEVVVYAEKPLIQTKDGNITFNAGETPLSAGSTAGELLKNVPLVTTDPDGKVLLKGKEPKILIDDKPVQLNQQQLQDLLESMSGSMIERIEVMTTPPPQYANEQGGVINIVTRKGKVGIGGRISVSAGTRGQQNMNLYFSYRKRGLSINFNAGTGSNVYEGHGFSKRENIYTDSVNHFNTSSNYRNRNTRPGSRLAIDYELDKRNSLNVVAQFNQNLFHNRSETEYINVNRFGDVYKLSERAILSEGESESPTLNLTYLHKGKKVGETLRLIGNANYSYNRNDRNFFQEYLTSDHVKTGVDSSQRQYTDSWNHGYSWRLDYDKMLSNKKTFLSAGGAYVVSVSKVMVNAFYLKKPENQFTRSDNLSNEFRFRQGVGTIRFSLKHIILEGFNLQAGITAEEAEVQFDLYKTQSKVFNNYWSWLPFANVSRAWKNKTNLSFAYRRSIRRPGITELNPTIDNGDPYNIRFGNPYLRPSLAHNFDLVAGRNTDKLYLNVGLGYNVVEDIYSQLRTLLPDGKTQITYENISNRTEYEVSSWSGYTISKKLRMNFSATYTYNQYSLHDRLVNRYRNGGSLGTNLNSNFTPGDNWNLTGNFTFNRYANPQGSVRTALSMNVGLQRKFFEKKWIATINIIDPIKQQSNHSFTYAPNFNLESFSQTRTRNLRLTLAYVFNNAGRKTASSRK